MKKCLIKKHKYHTITSMFKEATLEDEKVQKKILKEIETAGPITNERKQITIQEQNPKEQNPKQQTRICLTCKKIEIRIDDSLNGTRMDKIGILETFEGFTKYMQLNCVMSHIEMTYKNIKLLKKMSLRDSNMVFKLHKVITQDILLYKQIK